jgi:hypothetical protein
MTSAGCGISTAGIGRMTSPWGIGYRTSLVVIDRRTCVMGIGRAYGSVWIRGEAALQPFPRLSLYSWSPLRIPERGALQLYTGLMVIIDPPPSWDWV